MKINYVMSLIALLAFTSVVSSAHDQGATLSGTTSGEQKNIVETIKKQAVYGTSIVGGALLGVLSHNLIDRVYPGASAPVKRLFMRALISSGLGIAIGFPVNVTLNNLDYKDATYLFAGAYHLAEGGYAAHAAYDSNDNYSKICECIWMGLNTSSIVAIINNCRDNVVTE